MFFMMVHRLHRLSQKFACCDLNLCYHQPILTSSSLCRACSRGRSFLRPMPAQTSSSCHQRLRPLVTTCNWCHCLLASTAPALLGLCAGAPARSLHLVHLDIWLRQGFTACAVSCNFLLWPCRVCGSGGDGQRATSGGCGGRGLAGHHHTARHHRWAASTAAAQSLESRLFRGRPACLPAVTQRA